MRKLDIIIDKTKIFKQKYVTVKMQEKEKD